MDDRTKRFIDECLKLSDDLLLKVATELIVYKKLSNGTKKHLTESLKEKTNECGAV